MAEKLGSLMQELAKQNLAMDGAPLGIFHDALNPQAGAEPLWEVAVAVEGNPEVQPPLVKKEYAYPKLLAFIEQNGFKPCGPALETWMDDPRQTKPEDCRTLIVIPVEKKRPDKHSVWEEWVGTPSRRSVLFQDNQSLGIGAEMGQGQVGSAEPQVFS